MKAAEQRAMDAERRAEAAERQLAELRLQAPAAAEAAPRLASPGKPRRSARQKRV